MWLLSQISIQHRHHCFKSANQVPCSLDWWKSWATLASACPSTSSCVWHGPHLSLGCYPSTFPGALPSSESSLCAGLHLCLLSLSLSCFSHLSFHFACPEPSYVFPPCVCYCTLLSSRVKIYGLRSNKASLLSMHISLREEGQKWAWGRGESVK